jgi:hypothetical protein
VLLQSGGFQFAEQASAKTEDEAPTDCAVGFITVVHFV